MDMQIGQLQKEIGEWEGKLKQQQHLMKRFGVSESV